MNVSKSSAFVSENDSVARAITILGDRWTFLLLRQAFFGVRRYGELQRNLGIARNVLASRLNALVEHDLLERHRYHVDPDWYEYRLTSRGRDLFPAILALHRWADEYLAGPEGPPIVLRHTLCGQVVHPLVSCEHCGRELRSRDVVPEPGPGALRHGEAPTPPDGDASPVSG